MHITWQADKAERDKRKYGLEFKLAAEVFADPLGDGFAYHNER